MAHARRLRTMLRIGAASGPNFAGHYTPVTWGCGVACQEFAIVDAKSGRVRYQWTGTDLELLHYERPAWPR